MIPGSASGTRRYRRTHPLFGHGEYVLLVTEDLDGSVREDLTYVSCNKHTTHFKQLSQPLASNQCAYMSEANWK